jgi:FkbM family methyltransferase
MTFRTYVRDLLSSFPRTDGLFRRQIWSRIHFPEAEMRFLDKLPNGILDVAVDVGAAHGSYAWILERKARIVFSFEPGVQHAAYMATNTAGTRVELVRAAVGRSCGTVVMFTPGDDTEALHSATISSTNPVVLSSNTRIHEVEQVTLDSYFLDTRDSGRTIDLLKVDVEGYELEVFEGARGLLSRHHPLVFCEIEARHNARYGEVFGLLRSLGYRPYIWQDRVFRAFDDERIEHLQKADDLKPRLSGSYDPAQNRYINNFVFQHPKSKIKVSP